MVQIRSRYILWILLMKVVAAFLTFMAQNGLNYYCDINMIIVIITGPP